jgi:hypothetical protein
MPILRVVSGWLARFRAQRWSKEILLAIALTLAAAAFIVAALSSTDQRARGDDAQDAPPFAAVGE